MAWNPSPEVAVARNAAKALGADRCIILYTLPDGKLGYASFGQTARLCAQAKLLADEVYGAALRYFDEVA